MLGVIDKDLLKVRFARGVGTYSEAASVQAEMADRLLAMVTAGGRREFPSVLEIGPGDGTLTGRLERCLRFERLTLLELVPEWKVFHCRRPRAEFIVGDAEKFDFTGCEYDLIVANAVFQWFTDPDSALARLECALAPGGVIAFSTFVPGNLREIFELTGRGLPTRPAAGCREIVDRHFRTLDVEEYVRTLGFPDPLAALRHLKRTGVTGVAPAPRWNRRTLETFCREYLRRFGRSDGSVTLTYRPLLVIAGKKE